MSSKFRLNEKILTKTVSSATSVLRNSTYNKNESVGWVQCDLRLGYYQHSVMLFVVQKSGKDFLLGLDIFTKFKLAVTQDLRLFQDVSTHKQVVKKKSFLII